MCSQRLHMLAFKRKRVQPKAAHVCASVNTHSLWLCVFTLRRKCVGRSPTHLRPRALRCGAKPHTSARQRKKDGPIGAIFFAQTGKFQAPKGGLKFAIKRKKEGLRPSFLRSRRPDETFDLSGARRSI